MTLPLPLDGIRIADFTNVYSGPYGAMMLADFDPAASTPERLAAWIAFWGETQGRPTYDEICAAFDAERLFALPGARIEDPKACRCGEVLTGRIKPWECGVFGTACTPERPLGTCMVSSEGACAAYYQYGRAFSEPVHRLEHERA